MKIRAYEENGKSDISRFRLVDSIDGKGINLIAVDKDGNRRVQGGVLLIDDEGIHLHSSVSRHIGLPLDDRARVLSGAASFFFASEEGECGNILARSHQRK